MNGRLVSDSQITFEFRGLERTDPPRPIGIIGRFMIAIRTENILIVVLEESPRDPQA
jgi:hypothetical protein